MEEKPGNVEWDPIVLVFKKNKKQAKEIGPFSVSKAMFEETQKLLCSVLEDDFLRITYKFCTEAKSKVDSYATQKVLCNTHHTPLHY